MNVKQVKKVAKIWEQSNADLALQTRGLAREYFRGFLAACVAIQDLIDRKRPDLIPAEMQKSKKTS